MENEPTEKELAELAKELGLDFKSESSYETPSVSRRFWT